MIIWEVCLPEETELMVETINGNIIIDGYTANINARSISGFIDLKASYNLNADLVLKTITGRFFTDLDIESDAKSDSFPLKISQKLNEGGKSVSLETISGDIFVRTAEL